MERNRELVNFLPVMLLTMIGFGSVYAARSEQISTASLGYGLFFIAVFLAVHLLLRWRAPQADPYLLPLTALIAAIGIMMIYRIDPERAAAQTTWLLVGVGGFAVVVLLLSDCRKLESYTYLLGVLGILALMGTIVFGFGKAEHGASLWISIGGLTVQPGEVAKVLITIFLAGYLDSKRELLATSTRRVLRVPVPPLKHLGPLLTMWGLSLGLLLLMNDLGTSLLFFGTFLAMTYAATGRLAYPVIGGLLFAGGSWLAYLVKGTVRTRVDIWLNPWDKAQDAGYQVVQSLFSIADGGLFGTGLGRGHVLTESGDTIVPELETDFIFSAIAEELGLVGASALILLFLLFCYRGYRIAAASDDGFLKLLAVGLTFGFALQTFVILGGVMKLIPLTGITLPFVSYGGSSIVANFAALALLLLISNHANAEARP